MKKYLLICVFIMAFLSFTAFADEAVIGDASYVIASDGSLEASFSVETENTDAWVIISAHDSDGRLVSVKLVQVTSEPISQKLGDFGLISIVKINVVESKTTLVPLCAQKVVENFTVNGDTNIPVGPLFPAA